MSERPWAGRRIHLVGVGGAGMSAYARAAHALGATVSGSDAASSPYLERLVSDGVLSATVGHRAGNVPAGEGVELYYSSAIPAENPERVAARERGLAEGGRARLLGELTSLRRTIAVAGTHGKTTTAAMIVHGLIGAGARPGWLIGAAVGGGLANAEWGSGEWLVVEADESDRSMLSLEVEIAVLTNVELDHHASFATLDELREAFAEFLAKAREAVVYDSPELLELRPGGVVPYRAEELALEEGASRFSFRGREVKLRVPGAHNAADASGALTAIELALRVARAASRPLGGADRDALLAAAIAGVESFAGAERRFELIGETAAGARVYHDYAHHPTEIEATLQGARTLRHERLVAVFQPHLFSRTAMLAGAFGAALALADVAVVLDVYPARERAEDFPGVSGLLIAERAADASQGRPVYWLAASAQAHAVLAGMLGAGDLCVVMGAGDVNELARELLA
ncbi:MAG: UDP-N-acetylmuramate--L-alanine ligase [Solirubrobacteraceae bacterium]